MMGKKILPPRNIHNTRARLLALGHNPRLHIIRPMPLPPPPRLNNLASPCKSVTAIRHLSPRLISETFWQTARPSETRIINGAETALTVVRFLEAVHSLKARTALTTPYVAGLRASEAVSLKVTDIDSDRMLIQVRHGEGAKDRTVML